MSRIDRQIKFTWLDGRLVYHKYIGDREFAVAAGYFPNGRPQFHFPMRKGRFHGICRFWRESGLLESEEEYRDGVLEGFVHRWYPNGILGAKLLYSRGLRNGPSRHWDEHGELVSAKVYLRGREVPEEISGRILDKKLNASYILEIKNAELRRFCLEEFGYERFASQMQHRVIDKNGEQELVCITWINREEPIYLVKVKCPSTGVFYTLRVPPDMNTVKQAIAWTFNMKEDEYLASQET
ncbi:MAG: DUF6745 domain-containing protein [Candidatus Omnitrophota bacterium]